MRNMMTENTFKYKVVIVTGGANGIGKCIVDEFRVQGTIVYVIDKQEGEHFVGDYSFAATKLVLSQAKTSASTAA